jgi:uncharacterized protein with ATP-grasp and redox domains
MGYNGEDMVGMSPLDMMEQVCEMWKDRALKAEAQNEKLKAAVRLAGNTFRSYEAIHKNKVNESRRNSLDADLTIDEIKSMEKAKRNKNLADAMYQVLKETEA